MLLCLVINPERVLDFEAEKPFWFFLFGHGLLPEKHRVTFLFQFGQLRGAVTRVVLVKARKVHIIIILHRVCRQYAINLLYFV